MLLNSSRRLLKAGGTPWHACLQLMRDNFIFCARQESPDSNSKCRMRGKKSGPQSQRGSNDISVCCSSEATRIPRGWMGQFRSRSEDKLIRELGESISIKGTWI